MTQTTTIEEAAEYLRLSLPLMSKYAIPVTPPNYFVWYEYVAGTNKPLQQSIDGLIEKRAEFTEETTGNLYRRHVIAAAEKRLARTRDALRVLLEDIGGSVADAGDEVSRYEASLAGHSSRLQGGVSTSELRRVIEELAQETRSVRETGSRLHERLEESRKEAEALRKELEQARQEATTDALTGLANRKGFHWALEEMTGRAVDEGGELCLLLVDIDRFKRINDAYGHLLGDKVIRFVASVMQECVKGKDLVSRYGGEEFAVLLPDTPLEGAAAVAEHIRRSIEGGRLVRSDTREPLGRVTVSVGVARYRRGEPFDDFIARADEALYRSKDTGRNRVTRAVAA